VARPPSPAIAARNHEINSLFQQGYSINELARQFEITPQRVGQVIAAFNPEEGEDYDRSLYRGYLWRLFEEIRDLYRNPGYKLAPSGGPARDPDGEAALDTNVRLQAGELELKILESRRKMDARDKQQPPQLQILHELANSQAMADIAQKRAEMEELARRAGQPAVVPGEVLRPAIEG
jgi:hypothetical protein